MITRESSGNGGICTNSLKKGFKKIIPLIYHTTPFNSITVCHFELCLK